MSDTAPSSVAGEVAERGQALNTAAIEAALADFRAWLEQQAAEPLPAPEAPGEPVDLRTLVGQFVALRHEVNLQTRATRNQQEQGRETLDQLAQAVEALSQAGDADDGSDEYQRPLLKTLIEVHDAMAQAYEQVRRCRPAVEQALEALTDATPSGLLAACWRFLTRSSHAARQRRREEARARTLELVDAMLAGHSMGLQRLERALEQHDLERIACLGEAFDPERMEALEAVAAPGQENGKVLEVIRPGYLWRGALFRFALVKVARTS